MKTFEVKVRYMRNTGEGTSRPVKETYIVRDETCALVEELIIQELAPYANSNVEVFSIKEIKAYDFVNTIVAEKIYLCKVAFITIQYNGTESRRNVNIYVGSDSLEHARKEISEYLKELDCQLLAVSETKILEVYLQ